MTPEEAARERELEAKVKDLQILLDFMRGDTVPRLAVTYGLPLAEVEERLRRARSLVARGKEA